MNYIKGVTGILASAMILASLSLTGCASTADAELTKQSIEKPVAIKSPKDVIIRDINDLLEGKEDTVQKYFGVSDVYTANEVRDRVSVAKITFVSGKVLKGEQQESVDVEQEIEEDEPIDGQEPVENQQSKSTESTKDTDKKEEQVEEIAETTEIEQETESLEQEDIIDLDSLEGVENGTIEVIVHICNIDYAKTKEAVESLYERMSSDNPTMTKSEMDDKITKEIAARAQNGEFDVHITLPIIIEYKNGEAEIQITEALKVALTGGWYNPTGATIESGECPLREAAQQEAEAAKQSEDIEYEGKVYKKSDLSDETLTWLENYNKLSDEDKLKISSVPHELVDGSISDIEVIDAEQN